MTFYKLTIPGEAVGEIQDFTMSFYWFLNNYGSTAWSRTVEIETDGEYDTVLEIISTDKGEIEKIEPGVTRGMDRWKEENESDWTWEIIEVESI